MAVRGNSNSSGGSKRQIRAAGGWLSAAMSFLLSLHQAKSCRSVLAGTPYCTERSFPSAGKVSSAFCLQLKPRAGTRCLHTRINTRNCLAKSNSSAIVHPGFNPGISSSGTQTRAMLRGCPWLLSPAALPASPVPLV